jgi:hypothetical protein
MVWKLKTFTRIPRVAFENIILTFRPMLRCSSQSIWRRGPRDLYRMPRHETPRGVWRHAPQKFRVMNAISCTLREDVTIWMYFAQQLVEYFPYKSFSQTLGAVTQHPPRPPHPQVLRMYTYAWSFKTRLSDSTSAAKISMIDMCFNLYLDINECTAGTSGCNHHCTDFPGTFKCSCVAGYRLSNNGKTCHGI